MNRIREEWIPEWQLRQECLDRALWQNDELLIEVTLIATI